MKYLAITTFSLAALAVSYGCSGSVVDDTVLVGHSNTVQSERPVPKVHVVAVAVDSGDRNNIPGFRHALGKSRFRPGAGSVDTVTADGIVRTTGELGTFATFPNGFAAARPHARSTLLGEPPLSPDAAVHNVHVVKYFEQAGLPVDQLGPVHVNTIMEGHGLAGDPSDARSHVGYVTVVDRVVEGVRVEGSSAWAQFNANGDVVAEQAWWPELPSQVKADVQAARQVLESPSALAEFLAKIPSSLHDAEPEVVIHHSAPIANKWEVAVTIDLNKRGQPATRSYSTSGDEVNHWPAQPVSSDQKPSPTKL